MILAYPVLCHRFRQSNWCNMLLLIHLNESNYSLIWIDFYSTFMVLRAFMNKWTILHIFMYLYSFKPSPAVVHYVLWNKLLLMVYEALPCHAFFSCLHSGRQIIPQKCSALTHFKIKCNIHQGSVWEPVLRIQFLLLRSCILKSMLSLEDDNWFNHHRGQAMYRIKSQH